MTQKILHTLKEWKDVKTFCLLDNDGKNFVVLWKDSNCLQCLTFLVDKIKLDEIDKHITGDKSWPIVKKSILKNYKNELYKNDFEMLLK